MTEYRKPYYHIQCDSEGLLNLANLGATWDTIQSLYEQPPWCSMRKALSGDQGCVRLSKLMVKSKKDCSDCGLCKRGGEDE